MRFVEQKPQPQQLYTLIFDSWCKVEITHVTSKRWQLATGITKYKQPSDICKSSLIDWIGGFVIREWEAMKMYIKQKQRVSFILITEAVLTTETFIT